MTSQVEIGSYADAGVVTAVSLVNALAIDHANGKPVEAGDPFTSISEILAVDPPSLAMLRPSDVPGIVDLAKRLRTLFDDLHRADVDAAAARLNGMLAGHPAHPHLAKEDGHWRLHHHPSDAALVPMFTAICAEAMARLIGAGHADRFGTCDAPDCERVFIDLSKNASRRFCSTACQNRVKTAAFRSRQRSPRDRAAVAKAVT